MKDRKYAVIYRAKEAIGRDGFELTRKNSKKYVIDSDWVSATSTPASLHRDSLPKDLKTWDNLEDLLSFMKEWEGHPWYAEVRDYDILVVKPEYKRVLTGYKKVV